jgi:TolA-binding protein
MLPCFPVPKQPLQAAVISAFVLSISLALSVSLRAGVNDQPPAFQAPSNPAPAVAAPAPQSPTADAQDEEKPPAPQILEEQLIENSMDVAMGLYRAEDYSGTARVAQKILDSYPKREKKLFKTSYLLALSEEHSADYDKALKHYDQVIKNRPASSPWYNAAQFRVGICYKQLGNDLEAINTFRDIIDFNPESEYRLQAFIHLGTLYRSEGNWKPAVHIYQDMIRLYPCTEWSSLGMQYLAECYQHQDRDDEALAVYRHLIADPCTSRMMKGQGMLRLADIAMSHEEYQQAISIYHDVMRDFGDVPGIRIYASERLSQAAEGRSEKHHFQERHRETELDKSSD